MDLRALSYFVAVYENGSLSAASKAKYIAQPSISASIKQLESSLSRELFKRHARGVIPTDAGEQLYPLAKQLLGQASAIGELFNDKSSKLPFKLGLVKSLGVERMSSLLKQFTSAIDALELTLVAPEDKCDARIISKDLLLTQESFIPMWQEEYQLVMPVNHSLRLQKQLTLNDFAGMPFIQRTPCEGWNLFSKKLQEANIQVDIRARIQTIEYAMGLVRAGLGCAFIPVSKDSAEQRDIVFRSLPGVSLKREIGLAYPQSSATIETLINIVSSTAVR